MELKDMGMLEKAIGTIEKLGTDPDNDGLLTKAKQMLEIFRAKESKFLSVSEHWHSEHYVCDKFVSYYKYKYWVNIYQSN